MILRNRFIRNVAMVTSGTAGAHVITLAAAPAITRLYGPEAFGILGIFIAVLGVLTPIAALTYPVAIVLPKLDSEAKGIAKLSLIVASIIALGLIIIIFLFENNISAVLNLSAISPFLFLIPVAMMFSAAQQVMQQWVIRQELFKLSARVATSQSVIINFAKIGLGALNPTAVTLIALSTISNAIYAIQLWFGAKAIDSNTALIRRQGDVNVSLRTLSCQHKDFPLFRAPQVLINGLTTSAPVFILAIFFDPVVVGHFTLSNAVLAAPVSLVGKSFTTVFYPRIVKNLHARKNSFHLLGRAILSLFAVSVIPFAILIVIAEPLFSFTFGEQWVGSGEFASILAVSSLLSIVHRPCESVMYAYGLTRQYFIIELVFTILTLSCVFYMGFSGKEAFLLVSVYVMIKALYYAFIMLFCMAHLRRKN